MTSPPWQEWIERSQLGRLLGLGVLVLLLGIPIGMVRGVIEERQQRRDAAVAEVGTSWGAAQIISGPRIVVPYRERWEEAREDGTRIPHTRVRWASFLPEHLDAQGRLGSEVLRRGIFEVPVFRLDAVLRGSIAPSFADWQIAEEDVDWDHAALVVDLGEVRALDRASLRWDAESLAFEPGGGSSDPSASAIHVEIGARARAPASFDIDLALRGSERLHLRPFGRETRVSLEADWPSPSFEGAWIPTRREVGREGFRASWELSALARGYPQRWRSGEDYSRALDASSFGVRLLTPVDAYRMAERSAKYAMLFLAFTFASFWLFDVLANARLHAVQYLLVGAAQCLFYLLEMSLAEHLGFGVAYGLASLGIVALICAYAWAVLRSAGRAGVIAGVMVAIYAYLYVVLTNEDYALLAGSLALFAALAGVMWLTRRVDWRGVRSRPEVQPAPGGIG